MPRLQPSGLERDASRRYESCRSPVLFRSLFCGRGARPFLEFGPCGLKTENRRRTVLCDNPIVRDVCENRHCNLRNRIGYRSHALPNTFCTGFVAVFGSSLSLGAAFFMYIVQDRTSRLQFGRPPLLPEKFRRIYFFSYIWLLGIGFYAADRHAADVLLLFFSVVCACRFI